MKTHSRLGFGVFVLFVVCTAGWSSMARAQIPPAPGRFLVAARGQQGLFARSVVLLIAYGPGGAFGVIVNRPTKVPLAKALADPGKLEGRSDPLYFGGPVALDHLTLLIRSQTKPPAAIHVIGDIYASGSMKALRAVVGNQLADARLRVFAGYAGWAPSQLDSEIARGGWKVLSASAADVFTTDPAKLWNKLIHQQELILVQAHRARLPHSVRNSRRGSRAMRFALQL